MRAMREFIRLNGASMTLAMHLHQAILTAVGYDDSKVVVLDNGEIFHDYDDYDGDGDDSVESSDGDEGTDNGGVRTINWCVNSSSSPSHSNLNSLRSRFTAAAIAGQARGGDVWVVPAAQAERLQHALGRPPSRQWPVDSRS
jgi:sulfur carrier protein ThiS